MNHASSFIFASLTAWRPLGYALIFLGMMVEGDAVLFTAAFLTHRGFFDFGDMLVVAFSGVLIGDFLWYSFGKLLSRSLFFLHRFAEKLTGRFDSHLRERPLRTIFLSKFAYGLHHPLLMRAGALIPIGAFLREDFFATIGWFLVVGGLGYGSSATFTLLRHYLRFLEVALLGGLLFFFLFWNSVSRYIRRQL